MATFEVQYVPSERGVAGDPRADIIAQLKSEPYYIPDLKATLKDWPDALSPDYYRLKTSLDARINAKAAALIKGDYGLLAAVSWPHASFERLETCTFWLLWLCTWDDEVDQSTSNLAKSLPDAKNFHDELYHYIRYCFDVSNEDTDRWNFGNYTPTQPLISSLNIIATKVKEAYNKDQVMAFVDAIGYCISCQQQEQGRKLNGHFPTPEKYWETRMGASTILFMIALREYADGQCIPRWIMTHEYVTTIWREANLNMSISNDILSLKKEIKHGDVDSIIPILMYNRGLKVQEAIAETCAEIKKSVVRLDTVADQLLKLVKEREPTQYDEVERHITGCRYGVKGSIIWSLVSTRYGLSDLPRDAKGGITIDPSL